MHDLADEALAHLEALTGRADARFRPDQLEAITALVADRRRVLMVQRTGWGKSAVYFIATRLLRARGSGPTIILSPLLALMRNQIEAAERMGVRAATINSTNTDHWDDVVGRLDGGDIDLLLISPERLANRGFRERVMDQVGPSSGLVVIDEAHCISDWGHDFRPDYRRIRHVLDTLSSDVPVLACTATANNRVVDDVAAQLGTNLLVSRGALGRDGLALQVVDLPSAADRLAWLAHVVPQLDGTGIVYCLTKRDAEQVAEWLGRHGVAAGVYTGDSDGREALEQQLLANEVKVVAATSALGMGFDKPDLSFVIHYQSPGSPIAYYQQVGRAGRQLDRSTGVLLCGTEDRQIQDWFISTAFPSKVDAEEVLRILDERGDWVKDTELQTAVNLRPTRMAILLKNLEVDGAIAAEGRKYRRAAAPWAYDAERVEAITALRRDEQGQMRAYASDVAGCRMAFLQKLLDDPEPQPCGVCDLCAGPALPSTADPELAEVARQYLRSQPLTIEPRKMWVGGGRIPADQQPEAGRALCRWDDGGWGDLVRAGVEAGRFGDAVVNALAEAARSTWRSRSAPTWVTFVPSARRAGLVEDLAQRVAAALGLTVRSVVRRAADGVPQASMNNSLQQLANVRGAFELAGVVPSSPVLLVDDTVGSRWTVTVVASLLRQAGCEAVLPLFAADTGG
ncbi:MAG TPA: RecQ family ATP-dependent DNA helicase [Microthrixaceae bacterium]|nr:RecQ family ATP-dependent DNA helicase [Microthrixaceae bacterium]HMT60547.1 RecQ family ATP-dependent DNA helicase [Microthrixaceae bacterium]